MNIIMQNTISNNKNPSEFLKQSFGRPVTVKLTNGTKYKGRRKLKYRQSYLFRWRNEPCFRAM